MIVCPKCGQENPAGARFCNACSAPLEQASAPAREERKVVTVLFADLVGFTARAERLDPEDVHALLAPYYAHLRSELERFGGTVEKFIGDAVMALFGAPTSHEDDPERAVRAALAIRDWANEQDDLQVRIAVNTGEALVALGARAAEGEGVAAGDVVNTAARLQSAAPVNGILVGETTYRATSQSIDYREAEPVEAKGKAEPITVWEALEARSRYGVDLPQAQAPLVGRERELDTLRDALERARSQRGLQLVTLVGVPGIGKSRLVYELFRSIEAEPDFTTWRQGRSLPYGEGVSFWALAEIVKAQAGILESDSDEEVAGKLTAAVQEVAADVSEADWMAARLRSLVGLAGGDDDSAPQSESFSAWRSYLESSSRTFIGPTTVCSTLSTSSSSGRGRHRSSCSAPPGPSCWSAGLAGAGARRTPRRSRCRRSRTTRRRGSCRLCSSGPCCRPRRNPPCSPRRRATPSMRSNTPACSSRRAKARS